MGVGTRPFTPKDKRLQRVCAVVLGRLGLATLNVEYAVEEDRSYPTATSMVYARGWQGRITFYAPFFDLSLESQLAIVVHEHLHLMLHPMHQAVDRVIERYVPGKHRKYAGEITDQGGEIAIDHAMVPILALLRPHIDKVL